MVAASRKPISLIRTEFSAAPKRILVTDTLVTPQQLYLTNVPAALKGLAAE